MYSLGARSPLCFEQFRKHFDILTTAKCVNFKVPIKTVCRFKLSLQIHAFLIRNCLYKKLKSQIQAYRQGLKKPYFEMFSRTQVVDMKIIMEPYSYETLSTESLIILMHSQCWPKFLVPNEKLRVNSAKTLLSSSDIMHELCVSYWIDQLLSTKKLGSRLCRVPNS